MSAFSTIATEISDFEAKLRDAAAHDVTVLVDDFRALVAKLTGSAKEDVAALSEQAAPVVAAAEADAAALAGEAVAGAEGIVNPAKPSA